jgi:hypothetical protein
MVSYLAEKTRSADVSYHENVDYLSEIMQVKVSGAASYLPS